MKMKTKYLILTVMTVLMGTQVMDAQNAPEKRSRKRMTMEQMAEMQAGKLVGDMGLDDKTAAKFTDMYKKYMKELNDVRKESSEDFKRRMAEQKKDGQKPKMQPLTDAEVDKMMRDRFKQSRKMLDIREKYYDEFRKFLSSKQVQKVFDQGQKNHGKFDKEKSRRAGIQHMNNSRRGLPGGPDSKK